MMYLNDTWPSKSAMPISNWLEILSLVVGTVSSYKAIFSGVAFAFCAHAYQTYTIVLNPYHRIKLTLWPYQALKLTISQN